MRGLIQFDSVSETGSAAVLVVIHLMQLSLRINELKQTKIR